MILPASAENIARAAALIRSGQLAAFPTETVYGLGANALNPESVQKIFKLKGRPEFNPLIVHVASRAQVRSLVTEKLTAQQEQWLEALSQLWPAPLSLVLPRNSAIPAIVSGGKPTIAIRIPHHPIALELLKQSGCPIAAPSANRSNYVSPTTAQHVEAEFGSALGLILDGGPCTVGIESTVVSLVDQIPTILRPGAITRAEIESLVGPVAEGLSSELVNSGSISPGMLAKHYSPNTPVRFRSPREEAPKAGRIGLLRLDGAGSVSQEEFAVVRTLSPEGNFEEIARNLYATLRELDGHGLDLILVERCPQEGLGVAIMDRLTRAVQLPSSKQSY